MRKIFYTLLCLIICVPSVMVAQKYTNAERAILCARADSVIMVFLSKSSMKVPGRIKLDDGTAAELKKQFDRDAIIFDDINAVFDPNASGYPYKLVSKNLNNYFDDIIVEFSNGMIVNNKQINVSYLELDKGIVTAAIEREISGVTSTHKYSFYNHDTLLLTMMVTPEKTIKIQTITSIGNPQVKIINDQDLDGVVDERDDCPKDKGLISLNGCPDSDNDGIPDKDDDCPFLFGSKENGGCPPTTFAFSYIFSGSVGYQFNNNAIKSPDLGKFNYDDLDKSRSSEGAIAAPGYQGSLSLNGNIGYYFGKRKNNRNKGISIGISATNYKAKYKISGSKFEYKSSDGVNQYRRIVTLVEAEEKISFSILNFPLLFRYKEKFSSKAGFEIFVGPSFISFISSSNYESTVSYEGIYQVNANGTFFYNNNYNPSSTDILFTESAINNHLFINSNENAVILFQQLRGKGYDFEMRKQFTGKDSQIQTHYGLALNAGADLFYHVTKKMAIKGGAMVSVSSLSSGNSDPYTMSDKSSEGYRSIYRSKAKSTYTSLGIHLGIILGI